MSEVSENKGMVPARAARRFDPAVVTAFGCILLVLLLGSLYSPNFMSPDYLLQQLKVASFLGVSLQYVVRTPGGEELTVIEQNNGATGSGGSRGPGQDVLLAWRHEHTFVVTKEK